MKNQVSLTIDEQILNWIDMERNTTTRSTFINQILKKTYNEFKQSFDWETEDKIAEQNIKEKKTKKFKTTEEALKWLKS
ncbi:MAG: hypothetical protein LBP57_02470 [Endomicrobium sp.]|nr:hypothetical protein [Endomicrobium sp.]